MRQLLYLTNAYRDRHYALRSWCPLNLDQLAKHSDSIYELRPVPLLKTGTTLAPARNNQWKVSVLRASGEIQLRSILTGHQINLGLDNFREYRSPKFLLLKCQLIFEGALIHIEPLPNSTW